MIYNYQYINRMYLVMTGVAGVFILSNTLNLLDGFNLLIGVILASYVFFYTLFRYVSYLKAILAAFVVNVGYALIRTLFFYQTFASLMEKEYINSLAFMEKLSEQNPDLIDNTELMQELMLLTKKMLIDYQGAIFVLLTIGGVYIGALLLSRRTIFKWNHAVIRLPYYLVYPLIASLAMLLIPNYYTQLSGANALIVIGILLFMQGMSILDWFWGRYIKQSIFLFILLLMSLIFNPYLLILIALTGLSDVWFNYRKLISKEEASENNPN